MQGKMFEQISIKWIDVFVNVVIDRDLVLSLSFSKFPIDNKGSSKLYNRLKKDLEKYFSGKKINFLKYKVKYPNKKFSKTVLKEVRKIPYGCVVTYDELSKIVSSSPRAVGQALRTNKVPILIPCHRVVSKKGIGGFSFGIEIKKKLLKLEGALKQIN